MENPAVIHNLEKLLAGGKDSALLRFSLGNEYLNAGKFGEAIKHLTRAVEHSPDYSAAWKLLGKASLEADDEQGARRAWTTGIGIAEARGDKQAAREMGVFLRRLDKQTSDEQ
ncbi:MAG: tetratricopeptide repeat protein [Burkholderiales bacterium]